MMRSLYTGVSGLTNHQVRMDVLSNNIANVNTIGYKASRTVFSDTISQSMAGAVGPMGNRGGINAMQVGLGVDTAAIDILFTPSSHQVTNKYTDVAINNDGFFVVSDGMQQYYTRAGNFDFDIEGNLVMTGSGGLKVQGWTANANYIVNSATPVGDIVIPSNLTMASKVSTLENLGGNLKADAPISKNQMFTEKLYDSLGVAHDASTTFSKVGDLTWIAQTTVTDIVGAVTNDIKLVRFNPDGSFASVETVAAAAIPAIVVPGTTLPANSITALDLSATAALGDSVEQAFSFTKNGKLYNLGLKATCTDDTTTPATWKVEILENGNTLASQTYTTAAPTALPSVTLTDGTTLNTLPTGVTLAAATNVVTNYPIALANLNPNAPITFQPTGLASPMSVTQNFSAPGFELTQYATDFSKNTSTDGYGAGVIQARSIDQGGFIIGAFSNGKTVQLGQISLATFKNQEGLERVGSTLFRTTNNSGIANIGEPGTDDRGLLSPGKLEMANVDLGEEFTNMIVTQRGFQSNSRVITTSDEMLQELIGLKR